MVVPLYSTPQVVLYVLPPALEQVVEVVFGEVEFEPQRAADDVGQGGAAGEVVVDVAVDVAVELAGRVLLTVIGLFGPIGPLGEVKVDVGIDEVL